MCIRDREAGDEAAAETAAGELDSELGLLAIAAGSGLALLSGVDNTMGAETLQARLQELQLSAAALGDDSGTPATERAASLTKP